MRISDWSSDVCSSDLLAVHRLQRGDEAAALLVDARRALGDLRGVFLDAADGLADGAHHLADGLRAAAHGFRAAGGLVALGDERSEEHTSELQSLMRISYAVFCLKKKK